MSASTEAVHVPSGEHVTELAHGPKLYKVVLASGLDDAQLKLSSGVRAGLGRADDAYAVLVLAQDVLARIRDALGREVRPERVIVEQDGCGWLNLSVSLSDD